ncbi:MAG: SAM-dependent methyltransferase, partial [Cyclobacteriaceae bacterium]|nr:SAM-dependent methyltransferase [Cyclobacteriaceae bacterium]
ESYQTIPFPFQEVETPQFVNTFSWTFEHFVGYLKTWSAVKHFTKQNGYNPLNEVYDDLKLSWGNAEKRKVNYPLLLRVGKL